MDQTFQELDEHIDQFTKKPIHATLTIGLTRKSQGTEDEEYSQCH